MKTAVGLGLAVIGLLLLVIRWGGRADWPSVVASKAQERFTTQPLNHHEKHGEGEEPQRAVRTFQQRYFWVPPPKSGSRTIFFYAGNEASVENYVKSCGLMWENADKFNAALVFAEHRFWGKSQPQDKRFEFAGPDEAIMDYIALLQSLVKNETGKSFDAKAGRVKVVAFGGSYGGMLAAWMRLMYPQVIDAAVASSAPVLAFPEFRLWKQHRGFYRNGGASYWKVVTKVYAECADGIHEALKSMKLTSPEAKKMLGLCADESNNHRTEADILMWIGYPLETLAMGDYTFPSNYITGVTLPARPTKLACERFKANPQKNSLSALRDAIGVMYNVTKSVKCYQVPNRFEASFYDGLWDQYWCRWLIPQETYFQMSGPPNDMFLPLPLVWEDVYKHCKDTLRVTPNANQVQKWFGAIAESDWVTKASRIVFANGGHDPWSSGGFYSKRNPTLKPIFIPSGAHHAELMFSRADDPKDITIAREETIGYIRDWLTAKAPEEQSDADDQNVRVEEPFESAAA